jgi:integrase
MRRAKLCCSRVASNFISITEQTRQTIDEYLATADKKLGEYLFNGLWPGESMSTRQGLDPHVYGTHSLRRTKATLIYRRTGNLRAVQLLLGHTKIESTVRYLGIDIDDALAISEQVEI